MPLSWNEIKQRTVNFSHEWKDEMSEHAEAKSFSGDFFNAFGSLEEVKSHLFEIIHY